MLSAPLADGSNKTPPKNRNQHTVQASPPPLMSPNHHSNHSDSAQAAAAAELFTTTATPAALLQPPPPLGCSPLQPHDKRLNCRCRRRLICSPTPKQCNRVTKENFHPLSLHTAMEVQTKEKKQKSALGIKWWTLASPRALNKEKLNFL
uniref:(northern house mosquito) hypothetical protein n=1 Tax=Culex pipiens TaxID=7175 RepID=A0A8D8NYF8_CULPI